MTEKRQPEIVMFVVRSKSVPAGMRPKLQRRIGGGERVIGEVIAQSETNDVSLADALNSLSGYRLVESCYEERETAPGERWSKTYYVLTYTFARGADERPDQLLTACIETLTESLWQVRVYKNPLFRDGVAVPGEFTLSVNCNKRNTGKRLPKTELLDVVVGREVTGQMEICFTHRALRIFGKTADFVHCQ